MIQVVVVGLVTLAAAAAAVGFFVVSDNACAERLRRTVSVAVALAVATPQSSEVFKLEKNIQFKLLISNHCETNKSKNLLK